MDIPWSRLPHDFYDIYFGVTILRCLGSVLRGKYITHRRADTTPWSPPRSAASPALKHCINPLRNRCGCTYRRLDFLDTFLSRKKYRKKKSACISRILCNFADLLYWKLCKNPYTPSSCRFTTKKRFCRSFTKRYPR